MNWETFITTAISTIATFGLMYYLQKALERNTDWRVRELKLPIQL